MIENEMELMANIQYVHKMGHERLFISCIWCTYMGCSSYNLRAKITKFRKSQSRSEIVYKYYNNYYLLLLLGISCVSEA